MNRKERRRGTQTQHGTADARSDALRDVILQALPKIWPEASPVAAAAPPMVLVEITHALALILGAMMAGILIRSDEELFQEALLRVTGVVDQHAHGIKRVVDNMPPRSNTMQ